MTHGVIYLLTGPGHGVRLVASLYRLRQHFDGPVTVYTTQAASHEIGAYCEADTRLNIEHRTFGEVASPRNSAFLTKLTLLKHAPYRVTVHLDCDTLVAGDIRPLFHAAEQCGFAATQFANWHTRKRTIRRRIGQWERVFPPAAYDAADYCRLLNEALQPAPAVNGGVFAFSKACQMLDAWLELALAGWETFICDEIALQLLLPRFPHQILDCRFNCSPIYALDQPDVRVWHFHGERHLSRETCRALWWPTYETCISENVAKIADWTPGGDRRLAGYLRSIGVMSA